VIRTSSNPSTFVTTCLRVLRTILIIIYSRNSMNLNHLSRQLFMNLNGSFININLLDSTDIWQTHRIPKPIFIFLGKSSYCLYIQQAKGAQCSNGLWPEKIQTGTDSRRHPGESGDSSRGKSGFAHGFDDVALEGLQGIRDRIR